MTRYLLIFIALMIYGLAPAQKLAERQVLKLRAEVQVNPASIQLSWPPSSSANQFSVYRRVSLDSMYWGKSHRDTFRKRHNVFRYSGGGG